MIKNFLRALRTQRWDDHRYYHHSRINQSLHFVSAVSFLVGYAMMFFDPVAAALIGWLVSMTTRQAGHFFFEPKGYDHVNQATHEHKEEIKVGYNLRRKVVLMTIWALSPLVLYLDPTLFGLFTPWVSPADFMRQVAKIWLAVGRRRPVVPHRASVLHPRRRDRPGLDDQDPDRPVQRLQTLPQGAAVAAEGRTDRSRSRSRSSTAWKSSTPELLERSVMRSLIVMPGACPGHPRLDSIISKEDVDGRDICAK